MRRLCIVTLASAAVLLSAAACAKNTGSSSTTTTTAQSSPAAMSSTSPSAAMGKAASSGNGAQVFASNCSSCHQAKGQGIPQTFPPLAKNPVVTGNPTQVIHIVEYGLNGKISALGKPYNGSMPAWKGNLSESDIASVITYIRSSWGNSASAVTPSQVTAVHK
ncbi:MAG: cytochrome c [Candidatus Eremiobacteraeota bacterium]|nr:cytochrome c [Candidatus Eremiobacteraeota bacterium]